MTRRGLYPPIEPYDSGRLKVSARHEIYWERVGTPGATPAVYLHGGPGGGCNASFRRFHDPARYDLLLFDQRGCGRSTPYAALEENTTWDLVADMEALRARFDVARWQVFGGSWGSTLALAYAVTHPERVSALALRGIFLLRRAELEWFYGADGGARWLYPELFEPFEALIPKAERGDMIAAYYRRLTSDDPAQRRDAARRWSLWEGSTLSLLPNPARLEHFGDDRFAEAFARIECHYFVNGGFFERDGWLLEQTAKLADIPGVIVQGRQDVVTPARSAHDLARAWSGADLRIVPDAGHAGDEPGNIHELVSATDRFADLR